MGNSIEDYRAAIGLCNTKKRCLYGLVNFRAESYQQIMLTNLQCSIFAISLFFPQSTIPEINIVFLLFVLQFILIKGDVETHPGPGTYNSNTQMNITNNNVDKYISICNINIRSVRNKLDFLQNFADEYDILYVTESHFDVNINNDDISLDFFSKTLTRKDRNNSGGGFLIYFKDDISGERVTDLENDTDETIWIKVRARGQTFLLCNTYRPEWTDTEYGTRLNHAIGMGYI